MRIQDIINAIEELAPINYAEEFDNVGLLVGSSQNKVTGTLITLDTLEAVVDEAIEKNCNLIISFHPIIFSGLKKLNGSDYVEKTVIKAIQNKIAIYAIHTALDNCFEGVNNAICERLNLLNRKILIPKKFTIQKLTTYVPVSNIEQVRNALFDVGAGGIGDYDNCSFNIEGIGSFKGNERAKPSIGEIGEMRYEKEVQLNVTFPKHLTAPILKKLFEEHPYEEVAYEIISLENTNQNIGMGMIGNLPEVMNEKDFLKLVKQKFNCGIVRHSKFLNKPVQKIAVLGGSGSFAIEAAKRAEADIFITSDLKYHDFFKAENIVLADIGHYESEQFTKNLLFSYLTKKLPNFAFILSNTDTNPIKYL
ncbi:MAG TPA: Nif3-like dinuclear metal center hexameric protein [Salinimicrobium sp.]|nr:Nif3-like dinuclear metal center hexameric protein [Salinimicrobium sp.]